MYFTTKEANFQRFSACLAHVTPFDRSDKQGFQASYSKVPCCLTSRIANIRITSGYTVVLHNIHYDLTEVVSNLMHTAKQAHYDAY